MPLSMPPKRPTRPRTTLRRFDPTDSGRLRAAPRLRSSRTLEAEWPRSRKSSSSMECAPRSGAPAKRACTGTPAPTTSSSRRSSGCSSATPHVPTDRIDDVAHRRDHRRPATRDSPSAAPPRSSPDCRRPCPGFAIDRMCAGAMTSVTTIAGAIGVGMYDLAIAGGVEHMGRHPMGVERRPEPAVRRREARRARTRSTWASRPSASTTASRTSPRSAPTASGC